LAFTPTPSFHSSPSLHPTPLLQINKQPPIHQQLTTIHIPTQLRTRQKHGRPHKIRHRARPPQRNPPLHILPLPLVLKILLVQLRLDGAGEEGVASDVVRAEGAGAGLDEGEDAGFGRGVVGLLGAADEGRDGGDADYRATGGRLRGHLVRGRLDGVEGAGEICVQGFVPEVWSDTDGENY
jgi:hypothetical protein